MVLFSPSLPHLCIHSLLYIHTLELTTFSCIRFWFFFPSQFLSYIFRYFNLLFLSVLCLSFVSRKDEKRSPSLEISFYIWFIVTTTIMYCLLPTWHYQPPDSSCTFEHLVQNKICYSFFFLLLFQMFTNSQSGNSRGTEFIWIYKCSTVFVYNYVSTFNVLIVHRML